MANNVYCANIATGGGAGAVDSIDGAGLTDGDVCFMVDAANNVIQVYTLNASLGGTASPPSTISPVSNAGTKRWELVKVYAKDSVTVNDGTNVAKLWYNSNVFEIYSDRHGGVTKIMVEDGSGNKESGIVVTGGGSVEAYYDNSKKFETTSTGISVTGSVLESVPSIPKENVGLTATVSAKALTVALKGEDGNDPSASNQVNIKFRSSTLSTGTPVLRTVTSAKSIVLSSGSSLGTTRQFLSTYPSAYSSTYVKSTTDLGASYYPYLGADPSKTCLGAEAGNTWLSASVTNQRFHIDLGSAKVIKRIYLENSHNNGTNSTQGVKNFTVQGSNNGTAFTTLTYVTDTNWTNITASSGQWTQHPATDTYDPQYVTLTNSTAYQYYAIKFADNWGSATNLGLRRIEFQEEVTPPTRVYVWGIDNAGTVEMALSRTSDLYPESNLINTTAEGGAGAADSASVMYSTSARTGVPVKCLGYVELQTGDVVGEWDNAPSKVQIMGPGINRTGGVVQTIWSPYSNYGTGSTPTFDDDTIPQITEGNEFMTATVVPTHSANTLQVEVQAWGAAVLDYYIAALFRDSYPNALAVTKVFGNTASAYTSQITYRTLAFSAVSTVFRVRIGETGGTMYFNSDGAYRRFGGAAISSIKVTEIFA